ncbi:SUKH-4 family immunity protein [Streptacidiphilus sp. ASG 303]|uniref:SUKH-4 family immunity protein n=1 Tax=Streptacidiphilus sp. ASG 303 TaxID=2896847 RepID=UPI001E638920|nr:SUKH-4 family immunity protein [Streptacidiphilus sp. ASG 303]MCD0481360.1 SUKH-4 family immunity protein [Streptacidiphilus sp. ASG 303]
MGGAADGLRAGGLTAGRIGEWFGADGVGRARTAPPAALAHGPSRRFLAEVGLPLRAADLELAPDLGAGRAAPSPGAPPRQGPPGEEGLLGLGRPAYGLDRVVLDGATGRVHLARRPGTAAGPGRDLLASDLSTLVALAREVELVWRTASDPAALGGRRGPAVADEVAAAALGRMREIDPEVFAGDAPPAHWAHAVLARSLRWGARPGGPGGPAYEITPDLVAELGEPYRYAEADLPERLVHGPTRRLLAEVGVPLGDGLFQEPEERLVPFGEAWPECFEDVEPGDPDARWHQRDFLLLAGWVDDLPVVLDGATGRLEVPVGGDEGRPDAYLNRDLSALLHVCWAVRRVRTENSRWRRGPAPLPWRAYAPDALLGMWAERLVEHLDPEAFAEPSRPWRSLAEDGPMGGLAG